MAQITLIYGSTTGNTESAAQEIASALSGHTVRLVDVSSAGAADFSSPNLILGCSTWGCGDLQDDWDCALSGLSSADLSGSVVALYGCGDSGSYPDTFVDALGTLHTAVLGAGGVVVGSVETEGYDFSDSTAVVDGVFVGLPLDDSSDDLNSQRISNWASLISPKFL